jgi:RNA polymerase-binding transcription factor DksA
MHRSDVVAALDVDREHTLTRIAALDAELDDIMSGGHENGDDEHDPEGSTIAFERARTISLLQEARNHLDHIEHALLRVADGTYGICVHCQAEISPERLSARPETQTCIGCASGTTR